MDSPGVGSPPRRAGAGRILFLPAPTTVPSSEPTSREPADRAIQKPAPPDAGVVVAEAGATVVGELLVVPDPLLDPHAVTPTPVIARHAIAAIRGRTTLLTLVYPVKVPILLCHGEIGALAPNNGYQNPPPPDKTVVVVVDAWVVGGAVVVVTRVVVGGAVVAVVRVVLVVAVDDGDGMVDGAIEVAVCEGEAVVADVPPLAGDEVDEDACDAGAVPGATVPEAAGPAAAITTSDQVPHTSVTFPCTCPGAVSSEK